MRFNVPEVDAQQGVLQTLSIGDVAIGPITIGQMVVDNIDVSFSAGPVVLHNVVVTVSIGLTFSWSITIPMPWPFDDIHLGDSYDLGPFAFPPMPLSDVTVPTLDVQLQVPSITASNVAATVSPMSNLQLSNAAADAIQATDVSLPAAGFSLAGLMLTSVNGTALTVPAATLGGASIDHLHGDAISVSQASAGPITVPSLSMPTAHTSAPLSIPTVLTPLRINIPAGLLSASIIIKPSAVAQVERLDLSAGQGQASVGSVTLNNVLLPYDVHNLKLSDLGINNIALPTFAVS